jgi:hypothetical protein
MHHEYDQININCPVYSTHCLTKRSGYVIYTVNKKRKRLSTIITFQDTEKYVIYNVNKEEYDTCRIMSNSPRIVAYCTEPYIER